MSPPFAFVDVDGRDWLDDQRNGLRLKRYQWPEYNFSVALLPIAGAEAPPLPLSRLAYFEFGIDYDLRGSKVGIGFAIAHEPFERSFPGRTEEVLDVVLPLAPRLFARSWPMNDPVFLTLPPRLRPTLLKKGSYFPSDEPKSEAKLAFERKVRMALDMIDPGRAARFDKGADR